MLGPSWHLFGTCPANEDLATQKLFVTKKPTILGGAVDTDLPRIVCDGQCLQLLSKWNVLQASKGTRGKQQIDTSNGLNPCTLRI